MLVSIVQRDGALSAAQKDLLQDVAARSVRMFQRVDEIEWTVTRDGKATAVAVRIRARSGVFRARGSGATLGIAAREAIDRALKQRRRSNRARVDGRDDNSVKGSGGRRRPRKT